LHYRPSIIAITEVKHKTIWQTKLSEFSINGYEMYHNDFEKSARYDKKEREQCKFLVESAKLKEQQEGQGEYIFRVRGPPSQMKIMRFRKRE